jgi:2-amino-4-hydroxy-6-hydroxymethyldihydropteridine diphosphokinase
MAKVFLLFGSNIGDRQGYINDAIVAVSYEIGSILKQSSIFETSAWGNTAQQSFYNTVAVVETKLLPQQLLSVILNIEKELGRERINKWEARVIDIDILYYDDLIFKSENLMIPHPLLHQRKFTLIPLVEIAPNYIHPELQLSNCQLLNCCIDNLEVKKT